MYKQEKQCPDCGNTGFVRYRYFLHKPGGAPSKAVISNMSCHCEKAPMKTFKNKITGVMEEKTVAVIYNPSWDTMKAERERGRKYDNVPAVGQHKQDAIEVRQKAEKVSAEEYYQLMSGMEEKYPGRGWGEEAVNCYNKRLSMLKKQNEYHVRTGRPDLVRQVGEGVPKSSVMPRVGDIVGDVLKAIPRAEEVEQELPF